jgi:outer membrane protein assembly factor BamB
VVRLLCALAVLLCVPAANAADITIRHTAIVSTSTAAVDTSFPDLQLNGAVADGRGGWLVTGALGVARLDSTGRIDGAWRADVSKETAEIDRVGGRVDLVVHVSRATSAVVALDATTGRRLWTSPPIDRPVYALAADRSAVFVGGTGIGRGARAWIEKLDARTGRPAAWRTPPFERYSDVEALAVGKGVVYAGGVNPLVAAFDERSGKLADWRPRPDYSADETKSIVYANGTVFIGGTFDFGAYDARTGRRTWPRATSPTVAAVAGRRLFLGGDLRSSVGPDNLVAFDLRARRRTRWAPHLAKFVSVAALAPSGGNVLVLGSFSASIG